MVFLYVEKILGISYDWEGFKFFVKFVKFIGIVIIKSLFINYVK